MVAPPHVYFSALLEPAVWGAELAISLSGHDGRGYIYIVEPTGPFEDDPNLTNKRLPGNPTRSYRTHDPLRIVGTVEEWEGHPPEVLQQMLESLEALKRRGLAIIEEWRYADDRRMEDRCCPAGQHDPARRRRLPTPGPIPRRLI